MKVAASDRHLSLRLEIRTPLRMRVWKSAAPERRGESVNLSERGILFASDSSLPVGTVVGVLLKVPEEITGEPTTESLCSRHVVRVDPIDSTRGKLGVGVQFKSYFQKTLLRRPLTIKTNPGKSAGQGRLPIRNRS